MDDDKLERKNGVLMKRVRMVVETNDSTTPITAPATGTPASRAPASAEGLVS